MSCLLTIDCSDRACSVALHTNSGDRLERFTDEPRQHAKRLLPMYRELMWEAGIRPGQIDAIALTAGPGSFTGLRIGFSFAQGLGFALDRPIVALSSLEALAISALKHRGQSAVTKHKHPVKRIEICLDARMGEFYTASFACERGQIERLNPDQLIAVKDYEQTASPAAILAVGSGFKLDGLNTSDYADVDTESCIRSLWLLDMALEKFQQGAISTAEFIEPVYLRRENAWKTVEQQKKHRAGTPTP